MTAGSLEVRLRTNAGKGTDEPRVLVRDWDPANAAVVICDMWDTHHCVSAARRVAEMAPRMNSVVSGLRAQGAMIVHAPGGCVDFYRGTPARERAVQAPWAAAPAPIDWNSWNCDHHAELPRTLVETGPCSCDSAEPCCESGPPYPWTRQIAAIGVHCQDAVSDSGQELFNLLGARRIEDVVMMGVHANVCVLGRPYGIRQLVFLGKKPLLCRDLTDSFHRDPRGHSWGTERTIAHIERFWCPTVSSDQLVRGEPFRFGGAGIGPRRGSA